MAAFIALLGDTLFKIFPHSIRARVDLDQLPCLRVDKSCETHIGKIPLARILDRYGNNIVSLRKNLERMFDLGRNKIRDQKYDCFLLESAREVIDHRNDVRASTLWLERKQI